MSTVNKASQVATDVASKGTFGVGMGALLVGGFVIGVIALVMAPLPTFLAMVLAAFGYAVYRQIDAHKGDTHLPQKTGSARVVGGRAAHSGMGSRFDDLSN